MWGDVAISMNNRWYNPCTCTIFGASAGFKMRLHHRHSLRSHGPAGLATTYFYLLTSLPGRDNGLRQQAETRAHCLRRLAAKLQFTLAAEESEPAAAAEQIHKIAKAQIGAGIAAHGKTTEVSGIPAVSRAAVFDLLQGVQVDQIIRFHAHCLADMLQRRDLIAHAVISQRA